MTNNEITLVALEGSPKQVAWANDIRNRIISVMDSAKAFAGMTVEQRKNEDGSKEFRSFTKSEMIAGLTGKKPNRNARYEDMSEEYIATVISLAYEFISTESAAKVWIEKV